MQLKILTIREGTMGLRNAKFATALVLCMCATGAASAAEWEVVDLGPTPVNYIEHGMGLNDSDHVAFSEGTSTFHTEARGYDGSTVIDLHAKLPSYVDLAAATWVPQNSRAEAINSSSAIGGFVSDTSVFTRRAIVWPWTGATWTTGVDIHGSAGYSAGDQSAIYDISDVSGSTYRAVGVHRPYAAPGATALPPRATMWTLNSSFGVTATTTIPLSLGMTYNVAYGVSNSNVVVGGEGVFGSGSLGTAMFAYYYNGSTNAVPGVQATDGFLTSVATAIDGNYITGYAVNLVGNSFAFLHEIGGATNVDILVGPNGGSRGPRSMGRAVIDLSGEPLVLGISETAGVLNGANGGLYYREAGDNPQECDINEAIDYAGEVQAILAANSDQEFAGISTSSGGRAVFLQDTTDRTLDATIYARDVNGDGTLDYYWARVEDGTPGGAGAGARVLLSDSPGCGDAYTCDGNADLSDENATLLLLAHDDFDGNYTYSEKVIASSIPSYAYMQAISNSSNGCNFGPVETLEILTANINPAGEEPDNWSDPHEFANCTGVINAETNIDTDVDHCGACADPCSSANGTASCGAVTDGTCTIACNSGYYDCYNGARSDGCETHLVTDVNNCNGCGNDCYAGVIPGSTTMECAGSACGIVACLDPGAAEYENCDGVTANGCEADIQSNDLHCGACNNNCHNEWDNADGECDGSGSCTWLGCDTNYYDLDGDLHCEYFCTGNTATVDYPDNGLVDADCDGDDGDHGRAVYVATTGADTGDCTRFAPCRNVQYGITRAKALGKTQVFIANDSGASNRYEGTITLENGISLVGGWPTANLWSVSHTTGSRSLSDANQAWLYNGDLTSAGSHDRINVIYGSGITQTTYISGIVTDTPNAGGTSVSTYGILCNSCTGLRLEDSRIRSGNASAGNSGGNGASGPSSSNRHGKNGGGGDNDGNSRGGGGSAGTTSCGRTGGAGGVGAYDNDSGGANGGTPTGGAGGGGRGYCPADCDGRNGSGGGTGSSVSGTAASGTAAGFSINSLGYWQANWGGTGSQGAHGYGGGGGGGGSAQEDDGHWGVTCDDGAGAGGGGGGGGACGGYGGATGRSGGASFAVFLDGSNSSIQINRCVLDSGNGGAGGAGGNGGSGGSYGNASSGGSTSEVGNGGGGGRGGSAQTGGRGGGGHGGDAYGLGYTGTSPSISGGTRTGGTGGAGGSPNGSNGTGGASKDYG